MGRGGRGGAPQEANNPDSSRRGTLGQARTRARQFGSCTVHRSADQPTLARPPPSPVVCPLRLPVHAPPSLPSGHCRSVTNGSAEGACNPPCPPFPPDSGPELPYCTHWGATRGGRGGGGHALPESTAFQGQHCLPCSATNANPLSRGPWRRVRCRRPHWRGSSSRCSPTSTTPRHPTPRPQQGRLNHTADACACARVRRRRAPAVPPPPPMLRLTAAHAVQHCSQPPPPPSKQHLHLHACLRGPASPPKPPARALCSNARPPARPPAAAAKQTSQSTCHLTTGPG